MSEYDQKIPQSLTADKPMASRVRARHQEDKPSKVENSDQAGPRPISVFAGHTLILMAGSVMLWLKSNHSYIFSYQPVENDSTPFAPQPSKCQHCSKSSRRRFIVDEEIMEDYRLPVEIASALKAEDVLGSGTVRVGISSADSSPGTHD